MEAYLLQDANAGSNLKLMIMIQEEGMKGYGIYWTCLLYTSLLLTMNCKGYNVKQPTRLQVAKFLLDFHVNLKNYTNERTQKKKHLNSNEQRSMSYQSDTQKLRATKAVSYTHLDLYKRQTQYHTHKL